MRNIICTSLNSLQLSEEALDWAKSLARGDATGKKLNNKYGENDWQKAGGKLIDIMTSDEENPVKVWYDQIKNYLGTYQANMKENAGMKTIEF